MYKFVFYESESFMCNGVMIDPSSVHQIAWQEIQVDCAKREGRPPLTSSAYAVVITQQRSDHIFEDHVLLTSMRKEESQKLVDLLKELIRLKKKILERK